jgi:glycosyltransferase involved in cell wall biosynthesis
VRYLGFLPEREKAAALAGARAVICSSPYESLSIVLLEAMARGTPALVNARSAVLRDHCLRSGGGLWYGGPDEFREALDLLVRPGTLRERIVAAARRYVEREYRWETVLARWRELIDRAAAADSRAG